SPAGARRVPRGRPRRWDRSRRRAPPTRRAGAVPRAPPRCDSRRRLVAARWSRRPFPWIRPPAVARPPEPACRRRRNPPFDCTSRWPYGPASSWRGGRGVNRENRAARRGTTRMVLLLVPRRDFLHPERDRRRDLSVDEDVEGVTPRTLEVQVGHVQDVVGADVLTQLARLHRHRPGQAEEHGAVLRPELHLDLPAAAGLPRLGLEADDELQVGVCGGKSGCV